MKAKTKTPAALAPQPAAANEAGKASAEPTAASATPRPSAPKAALRKRNVGPTAASAEKPLKQYSELHDAYVKEAERSTQALSRYWSELFGEEELPKASRTMIDLKIRYELLHRGHTAVGRAMAPKFLTNHAAAQELNPKKFDETLRQLVMVEIMEEDKMKANNEKKGKALADGGHSFKRSSGKTLKLGVSETWAHLFAANEKGPKAKRLTDEQITAFLFKEFPDKQSDVFNHVSTVRSRYNRGVLTKGEAPKMLSVAYDENGEKVAPKAKAAPAPKPSKGEALKPPAKLVLKKAKKAAAPVEEEEVA